MKKIEFLSASLPYGLKIAQPGHAKEEAYVYYGLKHYTWAKEWVAYIDDKELVAYIDDKEHRDYQNSYIKEVSPIIRHLDALTQECVQADYNDGKPFIPYIELLKMSNFDTDNMTTEELEDYKSAYSGMFADSDLISFSDGFMMIRWHFWPNKPEGEEVVYVTNEFNPYK